MARKTRGSIVSRFFVKIEYTDEDGRQRENRFTRVWVKQDGRWRLVANHYSVLITQ